jgi:hypothetical protein
MSSNIINIHTPTTSFSILHSSQDTLQNLFDRLSRKSHTDFHGEPVGPGWIKYHWNDTFWNLDDGKPLPLEVTRVLTAWHSHTDADYTIFLWRQKSPIDESTTPSSPTLHVHNPTTPLPQPPAYRNPVFYLFTRQSHLSASRSPSVTSKQSLVKSHKSKKGAADARVTEPKHKQEFEKFHGENGVRTVMGSIGPVQNGTSPFYFAFYNPVLSIDPPQSGCY